MNDLLFSVFPNENFVDLGLFQCGREKCSPVLHQEITIFFTMSYREPEDCWLMTKKESQESTPSKVCRDL